MNSALVNTRHIFNIAIGDTTLTNSLFKVQHMSCLQETGALHNKEDEKYLHVLFVTSSMTLFISGTILNKNLVPFFRFVLFLYPMHIFIVYGIEKKYPSSHYYKSNVSI